MPRRIFARYSDAFLALFVVAIALMLLVPLYPEAIDFLLAVNISFSLLLLLVGLYMPNALALLAFPALLLLTTLFRLGLNVASTRLILSQGEAGKVIAAFGTFLISGELAVGVIIFVIISLVNFIVIARGASRVSEVAARFALDALPGKQMAIDADLRAGLIDAQIAQEKREDLRKESQLYGSMDGAMKFVQGDVIAGFFITLTNILGGVYMGVVKNGMQFGEALDTYTVLTVGDGLVTQIPALLISICAGIVVTRVSSGENTTLGSDLGSQLFTRPALLVLAGLIVSIICVVADLPWLPFFTVVLIMVVIAYVLKRSGQFGETELSPRLEAGGTAMTLLLGNEGESISGDEPQILVMLDSAILYKLYSTNAQRYKEWWKELQVDFFDELGLKLPKLSVVADEFAPGSHYSILVGGAQISSGRIELDSILVEVNPDSADILGMEVKTIGEHPITGNRVFWAAQDPLTTQVVQVASLRTFDFMEFICLEAAAFISRNPEEVLSLADVHSSLKLLEQKFPGLALEAFNSNFINVARLTEILQELAREGISVRDFKQIVESIASYCSTYGSSMVQQDDFDVQDIVSFIRLNRKRQTISKLLSDRGTLKVFTLSAELEEVLEDISLESNGSPLAIEPEKFGRMNVGLTSVLEPLKSRGLLPVSILCRSELRYRVSSFLRACNQDLGVIAFEELDPLVAVEPAGIWEI
jgi:type III secretion protein V